MFKKIPVAATQLPLASFKIPWRNYIKDFREGLSLYLDRRCIFLLNSGIGSFSVILEALKGISDKGEVILPAYTAPSLIVAIKKANLKPVLCDITMEDFNMDLELLPALVSEKMFCIAGVHMFGVPVKGLEDLKKSFPYAFIIEDCAQGMGTKVDGAPVGRSGDVSFFSFNRGKNLPACGGGAIATDSEQLAGEIGERLGKGQSRGHGAQEEIAAALKIFLLSLAVRPFIYGWLYPLISLFKEKAPPDDFEVKGYTNFQAGVALSLLGKIDEFSRKRYNNGMKLIEGLKDIDGITLPKIAENTEPAFNRLPIVFKNPALREKTEKALWRAGIETSRMYLKPLHHIFDLGYKKSDFPNATYFAERLLTLPVHPMVDEKVIKKMIGCITGTAL